MDINSSIKGKIFDIQGLSVHDGPGNRTTVFMQGCTLDCEWCSNPEGINLLSTLLYNRQKCIACKDCFTSCKKNAIIQNNGSLQFIRNLCNECIEKICAENCYTDALILSAKELSIDELFKIIKRDSFFWGSSGGVTISGGEPLLQINFVSSLLKKCYDSYIHTAVETCGHVPWKNFLKVIHVLDWIFFDLKHLNSEKHKSLTGVGNETIFKNIKNLSDNFKGKLIYRMPIIPGINDSDTNLNLTADIILDTPWNTLNILPLHHYGKKKYDLLQKPYKALKYESPKPKLLKNTKHFFENRGITCYIGSETPF